MQFSLPSPVVFMQLTLPSPMVFTQLVLVPWDGVCAGVGVAMAMSPASNVWIAAVAEEEDEARKPGGFFVMI